jgi:hypothetical protein
VDQTRDGEDSSLRWLAIVLVVLVVALAVAWLVFGAA